MTGFERLIDLVIDCFEFFIPFTVVDQYEKAVVLTCGKYKGRILGPGFHWVWPFKLDRVIADGVVQRTMNLDTVVLTTKDGIILQVGLMIRWSITDIEKIALEVEDSDNAIRDITYGTLAKQVRGSTYPEINDGEWVDRLYKVVRKRGFRYGIEVEELELTDLSKTRVLRLINHA